MLKQCTVLISVLLAISGCSTGRVAETGADDRPREVVPPLIKSDLPFSQAGEVKLLELDLLDKVRVNKIEEGSVNGVRYRFFYADGSGTFAGTKGNSLAKGERKAANWSVGCDKDSMNDKVHCFAVNRDLGLFVNADGSHFLLIGSQHYPGSEVAVRFGDSQPIAADSKQQFSAEQSAELIGRLKNGETVSTRFQQWPYEQHIDKTFELYGFDEVYSYLQWAVEHID